MALTEIALRFPLYHRLVLGSMLVAVVLACPGGLSGGASLSIQALRRRGVRLGFGIPRDERA